MRILSRLQLVVALSLLSLLVAAGLLAWSVLGFRAATERSQRIDAIQESVDDASSLRDEYIVHHSERAKSQWHDKSQRALRLVAAARDKFDGEDDRSALAELAANLDDSDTLFLRLVANAEPVHAREPQTPVLAKFDKRLLSQLQLKSATIRDTSRALHEAADRRLERAYRQLWLCIVLGAVIMAISVALILFFVQRLIRSRLVALQAGAHILASGRLDYRLEEDGADELADVARSMNVIAAELQRAMSHLKVELVEHKRTGELRRESDERFTHAMEASQDGLWDWDSRTDAAYFSPGYYRMLGYEPNEFPMTGHSWFGLMHPDDRAQVIAARDDCLAGRLESFSLEFRMRAKDGSWRWIRSRAKVFRRDAEHRVMRLIGTHVDITAHKEASATLERLVDQRTAELRAMAIELISIEERTQQEIARDLHDGPSQTLAVLKLKMSSLCRQRQGEPWRGGLRPEVAELESLLDQANSEVRTLSLQLSPPVLRRPDLVATLQWLADEMARSYGLQVEVRDDGLPKRLEEAARAQVFRAARELLINIAKHARVDLAEVEVSCEQGSLVLRVKDGGVGFEPQRGATPSSRGGYGLFSVRERIGFIGGTVHIDSRPGAGTVVTLTLPLPPQAD